MIYSSLFQCFHHMCLCAYLPNSILWRHPKSTSELIKTFWQTTNWYDFDLVLTDAMTPVKRIDVQLTTGEWTTIFVDALSTSPTRAAGWRHHGYTRASGPGSRLTNLLQWGLPVKLYSQSQILMFPLPLWMRRPHGQTLRMYSCSTMWWNWKHRTNTCWITLNGWSNKMNEWIRL